MGLRAESVDELDSVIAAARHRQAGDRRHRGRPGRERLPDDPGGAAHNEIKLSPEDDGAHEAISEEGMVLV